MDLNKLNEAQKKAVTHDAGPVILIAGAGTGKTTVISQRIAYLIEQKKAKPEEILAVTFTEKAAGEMLERVDTLLPLGYADLWINTFHGFCEKVLKEHALDIGVPNDFRVLDKTSAWLLVRENLEKFDLDYYRPLGNPTKFIHALLSHFSRCKDEVIYPEDYLEYADNLQLDQDLAMDQEEIAQEALRIKEIANAYHTYQQILLDSNALDFGDLINYTLRLFKKRPLVLKRFRQQFKYILVDEFQDTNWAQYELIKILAEPKNNLMVVGDDDQAIYKFRGAAIANILSFQKDYSKNKEQPLTQIFLTDNYRSGQKILDVAYDFIQLNNPDRLEYQLKKSKKKSGSILNKKLLSHSEIPGEVQVLAFADSAAEIEGIANKIVALKKSDPKLLWSDFAILVRANDAASGFVSFMRKVGLPHQFMASRGLYNQDIVLDIIAYLKLLDNYHESSALFRILSLPLFSLESRSIVNLSHLASKKAWSLYAALQNYRLHLDLPVNDQRTIEKFISSLNQHSQLTKNKPVSQVIYAWLEDSGYLQLLTLEQNQYNQEQLGFLNQFYRKIKTWEEQHIGNASVREFLTQLNWELDSGEQGALEMAEDAGPDAIRIMTVHGAKGLEFKYVFVTNLVQLRFPSNERRDPIELPEAFIKEQLPQGDAHLQEERRLFYVALTRAKQAVFLTWAKDYGGSRQKKPSRFLEEINLPSEVITSPATINEVEIVKAVPQTLKYEKPKAFSFSQLKAYETCPRQYFYSYVVKIPVKGSPQFSFGKTMHNTLQHFYQQIMDGKKAQQGDLFKTKAEFKVPSLKDLLKIYESEWLDDWYNSAQEKEKYRQLGSDILKEYYQKNGPHFSVPLFLEKGFNIKVDNFTVRGFIDRVDVVDNAWEVIDYKTGKAKDANITFDDKKQLLIYQLAAEEVWQTQVKALTFYYLNNNTPVSFVGTDKEKIKVKEWMLDIIGRIMTDDFTALPGHACQFCDYKQICPYVKNT